jgi:WD40 repeat protein
MYVMGAYDASDEIPRPLPGILSPSGRFLATYSADDAGSWCLTLRLVVLDIPSGEVATSIALTPKRPPGSGGEGGYQECFALEEEYPYVTTLHLPGSMAWSPEGERLAFASARDGTTADIYVADIEAGSVERLTYGAGQPTGLIWSPDGGTILSSTILDFQGMHELGGPFPLWGPVYATDVATGSSRALYDPSQSYNQPEAFVAWTSPTEYLADSQDGPCGYSDLRSVNVLSGQSQVIWTSEYESRAYAPELGSMLLSVPEQDPTSGYCHYSQEPGLYFLELASGTSTLISADAADSAWWGSVEWVPPLGRFLVSSPRGAFTISADGHAETIGPREAADLFLAPTADVVVVTPIYSPRLLIFTLDGEQLGSADLRAFGFTWSHSGRSLAFLGEEALYLAYAPGFDPVGYAPGDWQVRPSPVGRVIWLPSP